MEVSDLIEIPRVNNVFMRKGPRAAQMGSLVIIGHHLIFAPSQQSNGTAVKGADEFWLLHRAVDRVVMEMEQIQREPIQRKGILTLQCKNFMIIEFEIPKWEECQAAGRSIESCSTVFGCENDYPFYYRCPFKVLDDGWKAFDVEQEFARLVVQSSDSFRISSVNDGFAVCSSYPEKVIVPKGIGDDYLRISATFRDGSRFPVLSYYHKDTKSSIFRCGQPLVGPTTRRCKEDETILNSLLTVSKGIIIDTRAKPIAAAAKNKGGGHETQLCYSQWRYMNFATPRVAELKTSINKMVELCNDKSVSSDKFISRLSRSEWLHAVRGCLNCAANVAQCVHCEGTREVPVVVHGGESTDTTLIATSLAQVILDPDARTIRGFESLIEREWVAAGHPFSARCAHNAYGNGSTNKESPMFLCFLDCVYQIVTQYPNSFEFDENLLIFLFEHAYASEFGSFLGNNEQEKKRLKVKENTISLWSYVNNPEILKTFVNNLYEPRSGVIWPSIAPQSIKVWERLFFRWQKDWTEEDEVKKSAQQWKAKEKELTTKALVLRKQLIELSKESLLKNIQNTHISEKLEKVEESPLH